MNYNKNLIKLLDSVSGIQPQIIINKDKELLIKANDTDVSICYVLKAPNDYFDFPGNLLAFYDYSRFVKCFNVYDVPNKDPKLADTPVLDSVTNANGLVTDLLIKSSKTKSKISHRTARADVLSKPVFNNINVPSIDCAFDMTEAEFSNLYKLMDNVIVADLIKFSFADEACTITLKNTKTSNYYDIEYKLATPVVVPGELEITTKGLRQLPISAYHFSLCQKGIIECQMVRDDDIDLKLYISKKS